MDEILIWYEHEVEVLRSRVRQQNVDILALTKQVELRYQLYSSLEEEFNALKKEYEAFKTETIRNQQQNASLPPDFTL